MSGECQPCTIFCEDPDGCDGLVQGAIGGSASTIYICPGIYNGLIIIDRELTLIGAGSGEGEGITVLDANLVPDPDPELDERGRTVTIVAGFNVTLRAMRITGGRWNGDGGGIYNETGTLTMTDCVVTMNTALGSNVDGRGGGIFNGDGIVTMTSSVVRNNSAFATGGGIFTNLGIVTLNNSSVTVNDANEGGGIYNALGQVTLNGTSTVSENTATVGPDNCAGDEIPGCSG